MAYRVITPDEQPWITRPRLHADGEPAGHVTAGTVRQSVNHGDVDLVVCARGWPPEDEHAELLPSAV